MFFTEDCGKSKRPAKVILVGTHADLAPGTKKSPSGETTSPSSDHILDHVVKNYGYLFDVHSKVFAMDANAASSQDMKSLKAAVAEIKTGIVEVCFLRMKFIPGFRAQSIEIANPDLAQFRLSQTS